METKRIVVSGNRPFRILAIEGQGDGITAVVLEREPNLNTQVVDIFFQPTKPGAMKKQLTIRTNLDDEAATVTVEGSSGN